MTLLKVDQLTKRFGGITAVNDVSFELNSGVILGVIGPNGSGKTTLLNLLNGVYQPDEGRILLNEQDVTKLRPNRLTHMGIMRTFQNPHVFDTITVYRNMLVPLLHTRIAPQEARNRAEELLEFVGLRDKADIPASELSGGQQKLLEYARALMTEPNLVLMDEPFGGMHPEIKSTLISRIRDMRKERNISFIIVSHEISSLLGLCSRIICMSYGVLLADGTPEAVAQNEDVIEAYLGH